MTGVAVRSSRCARDSSIALVRGALLPIVLLSVCATCHREAESALVSPASHPIVVRPDYLRHLALSATVNRKSVALVALYANAPDYKPTGSPARDGFEGIASVDDAARGAVAYLRYYETSGDSTARDEALRLLDFVSAMEQGDGEFLNFVDSAGRRTRARRAASRACRTGERAASGRSAKLFACSGRTLPRVSLQCAPRSIAPWLEWSADVSAGRLVGGSVTATSEAALGLLALVQADGVTATEDYLPGAVGGPAGGRGLHPDVRALAVRTAELLVRQSSGSPNAAPWGAYVDRPGAEWHAWGSRAVEALAEAGRLLNRPDFIVAARREADGLWSKFLLAGQIPAAISADGSVKWFPQIAYGVGPIVEGYLALANATGDRRYAIYAGLAASWFTGNNVAHVSMYDESTGRTFDGIDGPSPVRVNRNAGAESTIEGLLALDRVARDPDAEEYGRYRAVDPTTFSITDLPGTRAFVSPSGATVVIQKSPSGLEIARPRVPSRLVAPPRLQSFSPTGPPPTRLRLASRIDWLPNGTRNIPTCRCVSSRYPPGDRPKRSSSPRSSPSPRPT